MSEFRGTVFRRHYAPGSKSDREAVMIRIGETELLLRREGGNPFADAQMDKLVGRTISGNGRRVSTALIMSEWAVEE